jgi:hypothetical protein
MALLDSEAGLVPTIAIKSYSKMNLNTFIHLDQLYYCSNRMVLVGVSGQCCPNEQYAPEYPTRPQAKLLKRKSWIFLFLQKMMTMVVAVPPNSQMSSFRHLPFVIERRIE